jgi:rRNA-processing protein FCF1
MEIVCDTSFLMVLCYEPVKNLNALESKFGKLIWLIHPETVDELIQLEKAAGVKRSKIANLSLEIIKNQIEKGDFRYLDREELAKFETKIANLSVDSVLLNLSHQKKKPLATIDKNLMRRALKKGVDVITLKNNKIIYVHSRLGSNLNHP